jgi:hypothetical protein
VAKALRDPLKDEERARDRLEKILRRLAQVACAR